MLSTLKLNSLISKDTKHQYKEVHSRAVQVIKVNQSKGNTRVRLVYRNIGYFEDVYHVYLEFSECNSNNFCTTYISEHKPFWDNQQSINQEEIIQMPNISLEIQDILKLESELPSMYVLGIRDCRHHVVDMLQLCYE